MTNDQGPWGHPPPRRRAPDQRLRLIVILAALAIAGVGIWGLTRLFPGRLSTSSDWGYVTRTLGVLVLASSALLSMRLKLKDAARYALIWLALGAVVVVGFTYKTDLTDAAIRMRSALIPSYAVPAGDHTLVLGQDSDGGYHVVGQVNGQAVGFLVDTGSSDIVLSPADAQRVGVDMAALRYTHAYETANGEGEGASYTAPSLTIGPSKLTNVPLSINKAPMSASLLGMAFLKRMTSFEFKGGQLILRWRG